MKRSHGRAIDRAQCLVVLALAWGFHRLFPTSSVHGMLTVINFHTKHGFTRIKSLYESSSSSSSHQESSSNDETRRLLEAQQQQIDKLIQLLASKSSTSDGTSYQQLSSTGTNIALSPLKVMLFIDGTWLYYSFHAREDVRCPIRQKFGTGWEQRYSIDWAKLPRIIGHALQQQDSVRGWMPMSPSSDHSHAPVRPVEVVRVSVYTSFRTDTPKTSLRYQMFQDMIKAKYDVLMLETIGPNEKCVDIQLAVDMLHYSTVPDAFDVALLVSGDRDFVPAMVRCRQKGRRVGLVSMRGCCKRSFYETPNIKDYDVIWLEDYLDEIIKPDSRKHIALTPTSSSSSPNLLGNRPLPVLSEYTIMKVVSDFILATGRSLISSRNVGRHIKAIRIGGRCMLDEVKEIYGGLYQFLIVAEIFIVDISSPDRTFLVGINEELLSQKLEAARKKAKFTEAEIQFFQSYAVPRLPNTMALQDVEVPTTNDDKESQYHQLTLTQLKEICREKGLKVSGKKLELVERIQTHEQSTTPTSSSVILEDQATSMEYLEGLLLEYLHASGGKARSRDVGRYLTANKPSPAASKVLPAKSALAELKSFFGSLRGFVAQSDKFSIFDLESGGNYEFLITLKT